MWDQLESRGGGEDEREIRLEIELCSRLIAPPHLRFALPEFGTRPGAGVDC